MEGYHSIEDHMQDCIQLFQMMQQWEENADSGDGDLKKRAHIQDGKEKILKKEASAEIFLPAPYLRECCRLTETEYWLVLFAMACELESGLCLDFQQKFNGIRPNLQYALHLLSGVFPVDFTLIAGLCGPGRPLWDILKLSAGAACTVGSAGTGASGRGLLLQPLLLNSTAFYFLLTGAFRREEWCNLLLPCEEAFRSTIKDCLNLHEREYHILSGYMEIDEKLGILINGARGSGKRTLLKQLLYAHNRNGLLLKMTVLWKKEELIQEELYKNLRLICRLTEAAVILDFQDMAPEEVRDCLKKGGQWEKLLKSKWELGTFLFITDGEETADYVRAFSDVRVDVKDFLSQTEKNNVLQTLLKPENYRPWQSELMGRYRLNIGELCEKLRTIRIHAQGCGGSLKDEDVWVKALKERKWPGSLGTVIENRFALDDLVVPKDCRKQLETVISLAGVWLGRTEERQGGREGLTILFHGSSGTGKTMAASVIAARLHLPLLKVDLSQVFDKYIGETEKHVNEIFRIAQCNHYILFFDEADALFSRRTGIQDSHDKYANVSTSYLLQRMETFEGILILATNLMNHFDDAFLRRIRFVIKFRNLEENDRAILWEKLLTGNPPAAEGVSPESLARAAELSPARIRAAVQTARMLAADENSSFLEKRHFKSALELEAGKDETVIRGNWT